MLKNRIELIEHEIRKLIDKCGVVYLEGIKSGRNLLPEEYYADLELITNMREELEIIKDLINKGHE